MRRLYTISFIVVGLMLCVSQSSLAKDRFFISAGFSGKWLKGTDDGFDISKPGFSGIDFDESG